MQQLLFRRQWTVAVDATLTGKMNVVAHRFPIHTKSGANPADIIARMPAADDLINIHRSHLFVGHDSSVLQFNFLMK